MASTNTIVQSDNNEKIKCSIFNWATPRVRSSSFLFSIILVLCVLFTQSAFGQMNIRIGATAGFNFSTLYEVDSDLEYDLKSGFRGGAVFDFGLHKNFSVVPELLFSQKGWKYIGKDDYKGFTQTATVNYIELPINLVAKFKVASDTRVTLFPGFYAGYALNGKVKETQPGGSTEKGKILLGKGADEMNPLDMGYNLGLGLEVKSVFFRIQLHGGLKNISNEAGKTAGNSAISLNLGYYFK